MTLYEHESLIIFDEVQLFPKARQAIKHLVLDGKYSYLETGSLISIKKNVNEKTYSCKKHAVLYKFRSGMLFLGFMSKNANSQKYMRIKSENYRISGK